MAEVQRYYMDPGALWLRVGAGAVSGSFTFNLGVLPKTTQTGV